MFQRIKTFFREVRIKTDFPKYEAVRLQAHMAEAELLFDTRQLEKEVATIEEKCCLAANDKFGFESTGLKSEIANLESNIQSKRQTLAIFERNYKSELNELYEQKKFLLTEKTNLVSELKAQQAERSTAHESLDKAYARLESAKNFIDGWYRKSERTPWLFGNGGKKLSKHSMFGQSFGDLDGYKYDRGAAISDIGNSKREISEIKTRQGRNKQLREENKEALRKVFEEIAATKAARQRMFDLKSQGVKYPVLEKELSDLISHLSVKSNLFNQLQNEWSAFIKQMEAHMGVVERKTKIAELRLSKARFLDEFHSSHNQEARRAAHRAQWLFKHGVKPNV